MKKLVVWMSVLLVLVGSALAAVQSNIPSPPYGQVDHDSAVISWSSPSPFHHAVLFGTQPGSQTQLVTDTNSPATTNHQIVLDNLQSEQWYYFTIITYNASGPQGHPTDASFCTNADPEFVRCNIYPQPPCQQCFFQTTPRPDLDAPNIISGPTITFPSSGNARFAWETDEASQTRLYWGTTQGTYTLEEDAALKTNHTIFVALGNANITHFFIVETKDALGNAANLTVQQFVPGQDFRQQFLTTNVPRWHNSDSLMVRGETKPGSTVGIRVNGQLQIEDVTSSGIFSMRITLPLSSNSVEVYSRDLSNIEVTESYSVDIDTTVPVLEMDPVDPFSGDQQVTLSGTVNELATIEVTVSSTADTIPPAQVANLRNGSVGTNSVVLQWDAISDAFEYAIYRDGVRITTTRDTTFLDAPLLDSGRTYTYEVSAVDDSCNEGRTSDPFGATTLSGGNSFNQNPDAVELTCSPSLRVYSQTVQGPFTQDIVLSDGSNNVVVVARDEAGNNDSEIYTISYGTVGPRILSTNLDDYTGSSTTGGGFPTLQGGQNLFVVEQFITITGRLAESPFGATTIEAYVNDNLERQVRANPDGTFSIEVPLRKDIESNLDISQTGTGSTRIEGSIGFQTATAWDNLVRIVARDPLNNTDAVEANIVHALCGFGSWWDVTIHAPTPNVLTPALVLDGSEVSGVQVDLEWQAGGTPGVITGDPEILLQPLSRADLREFDVEWARVSSNVWDPNNRTVGYFELRYESPHSYPEDWTKLQKEQNVTRQGAGKCIGIGEGDQSDFFGCLRYPLMIRIPFTDDSGRARVQSQCFTLTTQVQGRIDPGFVPNLLLNATVEILTELIDIAEQVRRPLQVASEYATYTCVASWGAAFAHDFISNLATCDTGVLGNLVGQGFDRVIAETGTCDIVYSGDAQAQVRSACNACSESILRTRQLWELSDYACGRVACYRAPTTTKYIQDAKSSPSEPTQVDVSDLGINAPPAVADLIGTATPGVFTFDTNLDCAHQLARPTYFGKFGIKNIHSVFADPSDENIERINSEFDGFTDGFNRHNAARAAAGKEEQDFQTYCQGLHPSDPACCGFEYMREYDSACAWLPPSVFGEQVAPGNAFDELKESACAAALAAGEPDDLEGCSYTFNAQGGFCSPDGGEPESKPIATSLKYTGESQTVGQNRLDAVLGEVCQVATPDVWGIPYYRLPEDLQGLLNAPSVDQPESVYLRFSITGDEIVNTGTDQQFVTIDYNHLSSQAVPNVQQTQFTSWTLTDADVARIREVIREKKQVPRACDWTARDSSDSVAIVASARAGTAGNQFLVDISVTPEQSNANAEFRLTLLDSSGNSMDYDVVSPSEFQRGYFSEDAPWEFTAPQLEFEGRIFNQPLSIFPLTAKVEYLGREFSQSIASPEAECSADTECVGDNNVCDASVGRCFTMSEVTMERRVSPTINHRGVNVVYREWNFRPDIFANTNDELEYAIYPWPNGQLYSKPTSGGSWEADERPKVKAFLQGVPQGQNSRATINPTISDDFQKLTAPYPAPYDAPTVLGSNPTPVLYDFGTEDNLLFGDNVFYVDGSDLYAYSTTGSEPAWRLVSRASIPLVHDIVMEAIQHDQFGTEGSALVGAVVGIDSISGNAVAKLAEPFAGDLGDNSITGAQTATSRDEPGQTIDGVDSGVGRRVNSGERCTVPVNVAGATEYKFSSDDERQVIFAVEPAEIQAGQDAATRFKVWRGLRASSQTVEFNGVSRGGDRELVMQKGVVFVKLEDVTQFFTSTERQEGDDSESAAGISYDEESDTFYSDGFRQYMVDLGQSNCFSEVTLDNVGSFSQGYNPDHDFIETTDAIFTEIRDAIGVTQEPYIVEPTSSLIRSVQCACIPAVHSYVQTYSTFLQGIRSCFQAIMLTGDGVPGQCEQLISTYVCDFLYDAVKCFVDKAGGEGVDKEELDPGLDISAFFRSFNDASTRASDRIAGKYGESTLYETMFAENQLAQSVCLFAFTGTWSLDISAVTSGVAEIPIEPIVLGPNPCKRKFHRWDAVSQQTQWRYDFGFSISGNSELDYGVDLICSDDRTCDPDEGFEGGWCDCRNVGDQTQTFVSDTLPASDAHILFGNDARGGPGGVVSSSVRYDRARLWVTYDGPDGERKEIEQFCEIDQVGGPPPSFCGFDFASGAGFTCSFFPNNNEWIKFETDPAQLYTAGKAQYDIGEPMRFEVSTLQVIPSDINCNQQYCPYTKFLQIELFNQNGIPVWDNIANPLLYNTEGPVTRTITTTSLAKNFFERTASGQNLLSAQRVTDLGTTAQNIVRNAETSGTPETESFYVRFYNSQQFKFFNVLDVAEREDTVAAAEAAAGDVLTYPISRTEFSEYVTPNGLGSYRIQFATSDGGPVPPGIYRLTPRQQRSEVLGSCSEGVPFTARFTMVGAQDVGGRWVPGSYPAGDDNGVPAVKTIQFTTNCGSLETESIAGSCDLPGANVYRDFPQYTINGEAAGCHCGERDVSLPFNCGDWDPQAANTPGNAVQRTLETTDDHGLYCGFSGDVLDCQPVKPCPINQGPNDGNVASFGDNWHDPQFTFNGQEVCSCGGYQGDEHLCTANEYCYATVTNTGREYGCQSGPPTDITRPVIRLFDIMTLSETSPTFVSAESTSTWRSRSNWFALLEDEINIRFEAFDNNDLDKVTVTLSRQRTTDPIVSFTIDTDTLAAPSTLPIEFTNDTFSLTVTDLEHEEGSERVKVTARINKTPEASRFFIGIKAQDELQGLVSEDRVSAPLRVRRDNPIVERLLFGQSPSTLVDGGVSQLIRGAPLVLEVEVTDNEQLADVTIDVSQSNNAANKLLQWNIDMNNIYSFIDQNQLPIGTILDLEQGTGTSQGKWIVPAARLSLDSSISADVEFISAGRKGIALRITIDELPRTGYNNIRVSVDATDVASTQADTLSSPVLSLTTGQGQAITETVFTHIPVSPLEPRYSDVTFTTLRGNQQNTYNPLAQIYRGDEIELTFTTRSYQDDPNQYPSTIDIELQNSEALLGLQQGAISFTYEKSGGPSYSWIKPSGTTNVWRYSCPGSQRTCTAKLKINVPLSAVSPITHNIKVTDVLGNEATHPQNGGNMEIISKPVYLQIGRIRTTPYSHNEQARVNDLDLHIVSSYPLSLSPNSHEYNLGSSLNPQSHTMVSFSSPEYSQYGLDSTYFQNKFHSYKVDLTANDNAISSFFPSQEGIPTVVPASMIVTPQGASTSIESTFEFGREAAPIPDTITSHFLVSYGKHGGDEPKLRRYVSVNHKGSMSYTNNRFVKPDGTETNNIAEAVVIQSNVEEFWTGNHHNSYFLSWEQQDGSTEYRLKEDDWDGDETCWTVNRVAGALSEGRNHAAGQCNIINDILDGRNSINPLWAGDPINENVAQRIDALLEECDQHNSFSEARSHQECYIWIS